nr:MAG TPA: hypothetical protein [Bacteriophage sp.]
MYIFNLGLYFIYIKQFRFHSKILIYFKIFSLLI